MTDISTPLTSLNQVMFREKRINISRSVRKIVNYNFVFFLTNGIHLTLSTFGTHFQVPMTAKYSLPQSWQFLRKQFLEASDWFTAYNRGKVFNLWKTGLT